jgi:hypothetical protein
MLGVSSKTQRRETSGLRKKLFLGICHCGTCCDRKVVSIIGLQCLLQQEWQYVQRVVGDILGAFSNVKKPFREDFIYGLLGTGATFFIR